MNSPASAPCDVAIVGGGMVGATLALALAQGSRSVALLEAVALGDAAQPSFDDRSTALGNGARRLFQALGVWSDIATEAAPIRQIHVSDAGRFGFARLDHREHGIEAFGYTVPNRHLGAVLWRALQRSSVRVHAPARVTRVSSGAASAAIDYSLADPAIAYRLEARLVVGADGVNSLVRQAAGIQAEARDYGQVAVVANLRADRAADGIAYERFTPTGPLALLPLFDGSYTVVWTCAPERVPILMQAADDEFLERLQADFGWRAGGFARLGKRAAYPLSLSHTRVLTAARIALVGNAAQALHPVAAQGFNLGLRDAATLAELVVAAEEAGSPGVLAEYERRRADDRRGMMGFTDGLIRLFGSSRAGIPALRNLGLLLFDVTPMAKQALSRLSFGFGRTLPRLIRGLRVGP
jgi:2-octaprenyl-6-methoxyphenol hydroxylase